MKETVTYNLKNRMSGYDYIVNVGIKKTFIADIKRKDLQWLFWTEGLVVYKLRCSNKQLHLSIHFAGILLKLFIFTFISSIAEINSLVAKKTFQPSFIICIRVHKEISLFLSLPMPVD